MCECTFLNLYVCILMDGWMMDVCRHACIYVMHVCVWIWDDACEYVCMYVCIFLLISFVGVYFWGMAWGMHVCMLVT